MKSCKISPYPKQEGSKRPWDMTIPPQSVPMWTALFGGISYSAWALLAYSYRKGLAGTSLQRIGKGKVPRFLYINGLFGANSPQKIQL